MLTEVRIQHSNQSKVGPTDLDCRCIRTTTTPTKTNSDVRMRIAVKRATPYDSIHLAVLREHCLHLIDLLLPSSLLCKKKLQKIKII